MKRSVLVMFICISMVLVMLMTGCSGENASGTEVNTEKEGDVQKVAILMHSVADDFIYSVYEAAEARAKELGFEVIFADAKNEANAQAATIEDVIMQRIDAIMLCPVDALALSDSVVKINEAKIPVTLVDRTIDEGDFVALCQSDNYDFGYQGAEQIVEAAKKAGIAIEDLKVLELQGDLASTSGLERSEGFQKASEDLGFKIVSSLPTYWETDTAFNAALDALQGNPDINAVFLASDGVMAEAVINAFDQLGVLFPVGNDEHIIVTTVDGTPAVIDLIKEGYIDATCAQPAIEMAERAIDKLKEALEGKVELNANEDISMPPVIGTIDNIDSKELWANTKK